MGLIRLRVREVAQEKGWTLKEVAVRTLPRLAIRNYQLQIADDRSAWKSIKLPLSISA